MSIATELTLLANSKQAIKNSINAKGGSITDSTPFADYSTAIDNLPSGGSGNPLLKSIEVSDFTGTTFNKAVSYITDVTIPSGVTSIGQAAFQNSTSLTNIDIPNTVTSIGIQAFYNCTSLTSITIPSGVTNIDRQVFYSCTSLTSITIPSGMTNIDRLAFSNCTSLTSITIPSGVTNIGNEAFSWCTSLTHIIVNATTPPTLGSSAFNSTNDTFKIYVPAESVETYKAASGWSNYASRIYPIQQVATVDGNPVYNYEIGNTSSTAIMSTEMAKLPTGTSIEFAEGITNMSGSISGYTTVTLPSTFTTFNDQDMIGSSVTTLTMKSTTPPMAERNKFGGSGLTAIYVPASAVDTYKADSGWSNFASIIQAIPVQAKMTITFEDDSTYVVPSDGATTINNDDLLNAITNAITDSGISLPTVKIEVGDMITELEDIYVDDDPNDTYYVGTFENIQLSELVLPAGLTAMGENTFVNPDGLGSNGSSITCYAVTPPTFTGNVPHSNRTHCTVYVPAESVEAYKTAWNYQYVEAIPTE